MPSLLSPVLKKTNTIVLESYPRDCRSPWRHLFSAGCIDKLATIGRNIFYKCLRNRNSPRTSIVLRLCSSHGIISIQMQRSRYSSLWRKGLTAFFLLWTLADLSVPGLCRTDNDRSQDLQVPSYAADNASGPRQPSASVTARIPSPRPQGSPSLDEDCFCCCSHIVPALHFQVPAISESAPVLTVYHFNCVTTSALPLYHPPRS